MIALHLCVIILQYNFHKSLICAIYYRCCHLGWSCNWPSGEIKLVYSLQFELVSKSDWCTGIDEWDPAECCSLLPIDGHCWLVFQHIKISHIDWAIMERALRVGASTTGRHIPPAQCWPKDSERDRERFFFTGRHKDAKLHKFCQQNAVRSYGHLLVSPHFLNVMPTFLRYFFRKNSSHV